LRGLPRFRNFGRGIIPAVNRIFEKAVLTGAFFERMRSRGCLLLAGQQKLLGLRRGKRTIPLSAIFLYSMTEVAAVDLTV
jgi:hypothetical protein